MVFLTDYRDGILGRISLEAPETRAAMIEASKRPVTILDAEALDEE
jgi:hypothetical protein